jgi:putative aldouronate transport system permease protein
MSSAAGLYQAIVGFVLVLVSNTIVRRIDKDNALF